ncbi:MAG: hypothetical protein ACI85O_002286 [Saprospiraceae bacterium]|jgi:hypothetical protein
MKRKILLPLSAALLVALGFFAFYSNNSSSIEQENHLGLVEDEDGEEELSKELRIKEAFEWRFETTKDLELGYPPTETLIDAIEHTRRLQEQYYGAGGSRDGAEDARWNERGPSNIGGRTRTILIDESDPNRNKIWAGGVSGGLWVTDDITQFDPQWKKVNDYLDNLAIGAIAQDPNNTDLMYFGTGESYTADVRGVGLFRSTDNGVNWSVIPSTTNSTFHFTQAMLVHPETSDVYAGTNGGLYRSSDNGDTWEVVLNENPGNTRINDIHYAGGKIFASNNKYIFSSPTGNLDDWTRLGTGSNNFPLNFSRCEFTICESDPNKMYALGARSFQGATGGSPIYASDDGGETWLLRGEAVPGGDFTNGQAWYDLDIAVDPFDCNQVLVGGVPQFHSNNGGFSFQTSNNANGHVDQHLILFDKETPNRLFHGNDGGVYYREAGSSGFVQDKNNGYNVTQFYAGAIHPEAYSNYILGGTQDNNSLRMNAPGIATAENVNGGDGMFCHIDQDDGQIQIVSSQFGNYVISTNGGASFSGGVSVNGQFVNISDYDNDANILYAQTEDGDLYRYKIEGSNDNPIVSTGTGSISALHADPNVANRLYVGSGGGRVYRIDNAHEGANVSSVQLTQVTGTILSIDVEMGNPDHLIVAGGNFGLTNNIWETFDGGDTWVGVEGTAVGNLPNVPVNWAIFNPANASQAMIATEIGVWATDNLDGENTVWYPPVPGRGTPLVRTDMLQVRTSDLTVLAATYGRGMFTCNLWSEPKAILAVPKVGYEEGRIFFNGSASINADSYDWELGDGTTSEEEDFFHFYENIGQYDVSLTINEDASNPEFYEEGSIKILPSLPLPFISEETNYGGSFDSNEEQWGIDDVAGNSTWERGASEQAFKFGTNTGENAMVTAKDTEHYEKNSHSYLYMPNFDFTDNTIYEFSFYARYEFGPGRDGFNVEYSLDRGENWQILGRGADDWYNFPNDAGNTTTPFPAGTPFFTGEIFDFTKFRLDVTELFSGEENVAFRFVFLSGDAPGNYAGVALDDVRITKFDGEPKTKINQQSVAFDLDAQPDELLVRWSTLPEYYAEKFEIYTSEDALNFELQSTVAASGVISSSPKSYTERLPGNRSLYFVQILGISTNEELNIADTIVMPVMVANKDLIENEGAEIEILAQPNPFSSETVLTFTGYVNGDVEFELYDVAGRLLARETRNFEAGLSTTYNAPNLATGLYLLRYTIEGQEPKLFRIYKAAN